MASNFAPLLAKSVAVLSLGATTLYSSIYTVKEGHRAVVIDGFRGVFDQSVGQGTHFLVPMLQKHVVFSTSLKPQVFSSICPTNNHETVEICIHALMKPDEKELPTIFKNFGLDYGEKILSSIGNEVILAVVAQFSGYELLTQRRLVSCLIRESLIRRAAEVNIMIDDVAITGFSFGPELSKANLDAQQRQERLELFALKPDWLSPSEALVKASEVTQRLQVRLKLMALKRDWISSSARMEPSRLIAMEKTREMAKSIDPDYHYLVHLPLGNNLHLGQCHD